ncbi:PREDICTED: tumor necrosis factor receptor superfamily member 9 [Condylura cristata]|uniref:tumor necrosis factor receptor superfamily member 9 n=1 Tax=Condylura cristata TaxID=143302 RepID=UPI00064323CA|nr:PREDICTED: tumor necrosis factor receptor superfamily member 9 [Condylura cristata]
MQDINISMGKGCYNMMAAVLLLMHVEKTTAMLEPCGHCEPGTFCDIHKNQTCTACPSNSFSSTRGQRTCTICKLCEGIFKVKKPCSKTSNTECQCSSGFHCAGADCSMCAPDCPPGAGAAGAGSVRLDKGELEEDGRWDRQAGLPPGLQQASAALPAAARSSHIKMVAERATATLYVPLAPLPLSASVSPSPGAGPCVWGAPMPPSQDCGFGTFKDLSRGDCRPWTDCSLNGKFVLVNGTKDSDVVCGPPAADLFPGNATRILVILLALTSAMVLVLLLCLAHRLSVVKHSRKKLLDMVKQPFMKPIQVAQEEDGCSCRFPEEEEYEI